MLRRYLIASLLGMCLTGFGYSAAVTVGFDAASSSGNESTATATLTVKLTSSFTGNDTTLTSQVVINYSEGDGSTATNFPSDFYDFSLSPASLTIAAGETSNTIEIDIQDDTRDENNETLVCDITVPFGLDAGITSHTYTINDDEDQPTVTFATATSSGTEGTLKSLTVNLNQDAGLTVTVPWSFQSGSSTASSNDLTPTSGTLTFEEGESSSAIEFTPTDDAIDEEDETIYIQFGALTNATYGAITGHQVTVADGDDQPEIDFSTTTSTQLESAGSITIYVELNTPSGLETSVNYSISGTSTGGGTDHDLGSGTATITAGEGSTTINFNIVDDALDEDNETIILSLSSPNNSTLGSNTTHTITITDNDSEPFVAFDATESDGGEGVTPASIAVSLSAVSGREVNVNYAVSGGTASGSGTDYTFTDGTLTFDAGETSKNLSLIVVDDAIDEPDETVIFALSGASNATIGTNDEFTYTINDNDTEPTIGFTAASSSKGENSGTSSIQISLTAQSGNDITVDYFISGGTADGGGEDYTITEGTASITSGNTTASFNVTIVDDDLDENSETIVIGLQNPVNVSLSGNTTHTMTITDNDDAPTVAFESAASSGLESASPAQLTVNLSTISGLDITIDYAVSGGTTAEGSGTDFTLADGTLTFNAGDSSETIDITVINDALDENSEDVEVTLSSPSNATLGGTTVHTYTINDEDPKPTIGFSSTSGSADEATSPTLTVELSAVSGLDITVDYAVTGGTASGGGADYTFADGTFTIDAGDNSATTDITISDDDSDEANETIIVQLSNPSSTTSINAGSGTYTHTIIDNDAAPTIQFSASSSSENEDAGDVQLTIELSTASGRDVSFDYAVTGAGTASGTGTDFTFTDGSKTITAGNSSTTIPITIADDSIDENDETVVIELTNPTNGTIAGNTTHTLTITDDDATPTISFDNLSKSSSEGIAAPTIGLSLTAASGLDVSVDYTVSDGTATGSGEDYTLSSGTISISAGDETATIIPSVIDDNTDEDDETFTVTLTNGSQSNVNLPAAGNRTHTFTITDNDDPPADFTVGTIATAGDQVFHGYWNDDNTSFTVRVPIENDAALEGGSVQVYIKNATDSYTSLGNAKSILNGDLGDSVTVTISEAQFEAHASYGETEVVSITASITDQYGNVTVGTASTTSLTIDTTDPLAFTTGSLTSQGNVANAGYWNSTNLTLQVIVPIDSDNTLPDGTIVLQGRVGTSGDWTDIITPVSIGQGDIDDDMTFNVLRAELETIPDFTDDSEGATLQITATIMDAAGNSTQGSPSATSITIDETAPQITSVASGTVNGYYGEDSEIEIHVITNENVDVVSGVPTLALNSTGTAAYESGSGSSTLVLSYTVADGENSSDLDYVNTSSFSSNGTLRDIAGNTIVETLPTPGESGSLGQGYDLVVDTEAPTAQISLSENPVNTNATPTLIVDFSEVMNSTPGIAPRTYILYPDAAEMDTTDMNSAGELTWTLSLDIPDGNDGLASISIIGSDLALNELTNANTTGRFSLRIDNTTPGITNITPVSGSYVNHTNVTYQIDENVESGSVTYTSTGGTGHPHGQVVDLAANQLLAGPYTESLGATLVDGTTYNMTWSLTDSADNTLDTNIISIHYDETSPTATISYQDTIVSAGLTDTVYATFDEQVLSSQISIDYAGTGADIANTSMTALNGDSITWFFVATIPSGTGNDGYASIDLTASDLAGNAISPAGISDNELLRVDNSPPSVSFSYTNTTTPSLNNLGKGGDGIQITATFSESMDAPILILQYEGTFNDTIVNNGSPVSEEIWVYDATLPTDSANTGLITITTNSTDAAGNSVETYTDEQVFEVDNIPPAVFTTGAVTSTGGNTVATWINGTNTGVDIVVPIQFSITDPTMIGGGIVVEMFNLSNSIAYSIIGDTTTINTGGNNTVSRTMNNIGSEITLNAGDSILTRTILYDRVGNQTIGDPSEITMVYDPNPPVFAGVPAGTDIVDTLRSTDTFTSTWLSFTEASIESGISQYEYAMDFASVEDTTGFSEWATVPDDTTITATKTLTHDSTYNLYVRCYDIAGNLSVVARPQPQFIRLNSPPLMTDIQDVVGFEDIAFADTVELTDADESTILGDSFKYYVTTTRTVGDPAVSSIEIDSLTGIMTWLPTQADTGTYTIDISVNDNWGYSDTIDFEMIIEPVNDSPVLSILSPDDIQTFDEDQLESAALPINLTRFATDVDDSVETLSWQIVILSDTSFYPGFPTNQVIMTPDTPNTMRSYMYEVYGPPGPKTKYRTKLTSSKFAAPAGDTLHATVDSLHVKSWEDTSDSTWIIIYADSNYYTHIDAPREVVIYTTDVEGLFDIDTIEVNINAENDPPVWSTIGMQQVFENDTLRLDLTPFVTDVDDSLLTFEITALTNPDKMTIPDSAFSTSTTGDSTVFIPQQLWSDSSRIQVIVSDQANPPNRDTTQFTIDVLYVPRPAISMWVVQNNAFSNYYKIFLTDSARKTTSLELRVQNESVTLDTVGAFTYAGTHSFVSAGTYNFDIDATGVVGTTDTSFSVGLALARTSRTWHGSSSDGVFRLKGTPGTVGFDRSIMIVDSSMFEPAFYGRASYLIGDENVTFREPVLVSFMSDAKDVAIYRRDRGISWKELPSYTNDDGSISAYSDRMGYYKLGPKTIFVPGKSDLGYNYPNPFNPYTNIEFDIGFLDGPQQKVIVAVYNIRGQKISTLYNDYIDFGRHTVSWNSKDENGSNVASGIYFVRLSTSTGLNKTRKMLLVR